MSHAAVPPMLVGETTECVGLYGGQAHPSVSGSFAPTCCPMMNCPDAPPQSESPMATIAVHHVVLQIPFMGILSPNSRIVSNRHLMAKRSGHLQPAQVRLSRGDRKITQRTPSEHTQRQRD